MRAALFAIVLTICGIGLTSSRHHSHKRHHSHERHHGKVDWCSKELKCIHANGIVNRNTMCKYPTESDECTNLVDVQTQQSRDLMLHLHNEFRNKLAGGNITHWPKAANMMEMTWDDEVESVANRWAMQCKEKIHDKCRRTQTYKHVGQNVGRDKDYDFNENSMEKNFKGWKNEVSRISNPKRLIKSYHRGNHWGHFTQVIWAESSKLGCGSVRYEGEDDSKISVDVCNYAPAGNMRSKRIYIKGEPASKCPKGSHRSKRYPNLCAKSKH
ncbi:hypothetical protein GE061_005300 [Apolygus lucorum]|uniref:SCP domain-containing protein n=1 Tax=Apolygus lucorum TaxID=248454 RepID=A0A6A4IUM5_APOLU|nr:hypothetical protein GE061_005300 [Apolygus lucorum]